MPQFDVHTPERLCNACVKTQSVIFDLHAKLTTTRNGLEAHQARHARLMQCAQTLQVGVMFNVFLEGSMRSRKLALSDDLLMIALINTRTNKVTNAYEVLAISVSAGAHDDAKESIGNSQLCFTMACSDQIFTLQALNPDLYQYWMDGIHLAQEMVMHKERLSEFEAAIDETKAKLHEAIQSQIHYAFPKVFPESSEPQSALTLIEDSEDPNGEASNDKPANSSDDESLSKSGNTSADANTDGNLTAAVEIAPPAALKMGRSLPRQPGYMSPSYDGALSPVRSPVRTLSPIASPRGVSPATSTLQDDSSPVGSPSESTLSKRSSLARITEETRNTGAENGLSTAQSPIFEADEHLRSPQDSHIDIASPSSSANDSSPILSTHAASKPIASKKLDFGVHALAGTPSSMSSYSPPISDLATTTPKRIETMPQSLDARAIVSGIANANLSSSHLSSTFDSLPSTPQTSEKIEDHSTPESSVFITGGSGLLDTPEKLTAPEEPETTQVDEKASEEATHQETAVTEEKEEKEDEETTKSSEDSIAPTSSETETSPIAEISSEAKDNESDNKADEVVAEGQEASKEEA